MQETLKTTLPDRASMKQYSSLSGSVASVSTSLQSAYNEQYTDQMTVWREVGGKYKAANIIEVCDQRSFTRVLECGAGEGSILKFLDAARVFPELYAIEISQSGLDQILKRQLPSLKEVKLFNGYEIPYSDKAFDMVYCSHVIEHVEHPRLLLRELKRVSRFQVFEIPLEYSNGVDRYMEDCLAYGHINIYTPSLFKFLLRSEGFEILTDVHTATATELVRFIWYQKQNKKRTLITEALLQTRSMRRQMKRVFLGKKHFDEYGYAAYTCLARDIGDLKIF